jgi:hypothetical protein
MKIKSKSDVNQFLDSFENLSTKLNSGQHSFYFYNPQNKQHCYIIKDGLNYILKTISALSNTSETQQIEDIDAFIWANRKYINKSIEKPSYVHHFANLKQYY